MTKTLTLRTFDIPQLHKFGIGFDSLFDDLMRVSNQHKETNYPPHNVIKTGDQASVIEVAVAGFSEGEIEISLDKRMLTIAGSRKTQDDEQWEYLHRGISARNFTRTFTLADHVEVLGAKSENGILKIELERKIPEEQKPKTIAISYNK